MAKECPQCKKENPSANIFCASCGTRFDSVENLSEEDKLHKKLIEMQGTIQTLEKALAEAHNKNDSSKENLQVINNLQRQLTVMQHENANLQKSTKPVPVAKKNNNSFPVVILIAGIVMFLIVAGLIGFFKIYVPYAFERDAERVYTYAGNTFLRSSPQAGVEHNILERLPYGTELILYRFDYDWSYVKWKTFQNKKSLKGYISSDFIFTKSDFDILNSIWGDNESKEIIITSKCRIALLNYFKDKGYAGNWQVFSKSKEIKPNTVYYNRVINKNSKFTDFAVIIRNTNTGARKCLLFSFDDNETPTLEYEEAAPATGDIVSISFVNRIISITYR